MTLRGSNLPFFPLSIKKILSLSPSLSGGSFRLTSFNHMPNRKSLSSP